MARWLTYIRERFPIPVYLLLSLGTALSGAMANEIPMGWPEHWGNVGMATFGLLLFFAELRLMDEFKDYEKDLVAHPERPLPRGLLDRVQVEKTVKILIGIMIGFSVCVGFTNPTAGALYFGFTVYLWWMYREFYCGARLSQSPFLYALTHQLIVLPICLFCTSMGNELETFSVNSLAYSGAVLGAFFSYEICRKLNPRAHPVLKTYLSFYGPFKTVVVVGLLTLVSAYCAPYLNAETLLWPLELALVVSLSLLSLKPSLFKGVEGAATFSLFFHIWAYPTLVLAKRFL